MKKIILTLLTFLFAWPVFGQNIEVRNIQADLQEAVVLDRETNYEKAVRKGDEIAGWRIAEITKDYITIIKPQEGGILIVKKVFVKGKGNLIIQTPETQ